MLSIRNVNFGGIKKKFQTNALNSAEQRTGMMSKNIAVNETVTNKMSATTLYPKNADRK